MLSYLPRGKWTFVRFRRADNYVHDMQNAGFALMEAMNNAIHDNTVENVKWGIRLSVGSSYNNIYDNTFDGCSSCK